MSKFSSSDQNTRLVATTNLLQKLQKNQDAIQQLELSQDDVSGLIQNLCDLNIKFSSTTCNVLTILYSNVDSAPQELTEILIQDFNTNFIFQQVINNFKSAKQQIREDNLSLGLIVNQYIFNYDSIINILEQTLKTSKNVQQKQSCLQLIENCSNYYEQKNIQKLLPALKQLIQDQNTEVRQLAQELVETLNQIEFQQAAKQRSQPTSKQTSMLSKANSSILSNNPRAAKSGSKDNVSYFPAPSEADPEAQNSPFSIVPPIQQSYLPFKPLYTFPIEILQSPAQNIAPLYHCIMSNGNDLKQQCQLLFSQMIKNYQCEAEWQKQMSAIQSIYIIVLIDNMNNNSQINKYIGDEINSFLQDPQTSKIIQSPRTTLSREALIILECVVQRYGPQCQGFVNLILDTLLNNIARRGVYFECQSVSLLKTIIIHCNYPKTIYNKIIQQLKTQKVSSAKCYLFDLAFLCILVMKIMNAYDVSYIQLILDSILQGQQDKDARVRQSARVFTNLMKFIDKNGYNKIIAKVSNKDLQNLQQESNFEAGFQTYLQKMTCRIDMEQFPSYLLQSGACNKEIHPVFDGNLLEWRARLILDDEFQILWGYENQFTDTLRIGQEQSLFGIPHGINDTEYAAQLESSFNKQNKAQKTIPKSTIPKRPTKSAQVSTKQYDNDYATFDVQSYDFDDFSTHSYDNSNTVKHIQINEPQDKYQYDNNITIPSPNNKSQSILMRTGSPWGSDDFNASVNDDEILDALQASKSNYIRTEQAENYSYQQQYGQNNEKENRKNTKSAPLTKQQQNSQYQYNQYDDYEPPQLNMSDKYNNSLKEAKQTAIHMIPQQEPENIDQHIMLDNINLDLPLVKKYLSQDMLNNDQIDTLVQSILNQFFEQQETIVVQLQDILFNILQNKELNIDQVTLISVQLVELFNHQSLQVRRKSDEMLRQLIDIINPKVMLRIFRQIIQSRRNDAYNPENPILNVNASLRLITYVVRKFSDTSEALKSVSNLVPLIVEQFQSPDANTRKTAVGCFIDLFMVLGNGFQPFVDGLEDSQLKLVVERMKMLQRKAQQKK